MSPHFRWPKFQLVEVSHFHNADVPSLQIKLYEKSLYIQDNGSYLNIYDLNYVKDLPTYNNDPFIMSISQILT